VPSNYVRLLFFCTYSSRLSSFSPFHIRLSLGLLLTCLRRTFLSPFFFYLHNNFIC
jgi:hypothetical protein